MAIELIRKITFALLFTLGTTFLWAQETDYPDYEAMKDSAGTRMLRFAQKHNSKNINTVRQNILSTLSEDGTVTCDTPLPRMRKKHLNATQLYKLCKQSSLVFFTMEFRPQSNDYMAYPTASAVALTEDGLCATNYHVLSAVILSGALKHYWNNDFMRFVMDADGKVYPVTKILAADPVNDLALFRVDTTENRLTPVSLGNPLESGEKVYCIAHPQGYLFYLTEGIVARNVSEANRQNGQIKYEMQITADYGVGASGGPIFDDRGNLAGMVSSTFSMYANPQTGKNFQMAVKKTVPVTCIKKCLKQKEDGKKKKRASERKDTDKKENHPIKQ